MVVRVRTDRPLSLAARAPARRAGARAPRVASFVDSMGVGGTELNAVRTAERLAGHAVELTVFTFRPDGPLAARYRALGVEVVPMPLTSFRSPAALREAFRVAALLRARGIEVVHAHDFYSNVFATLCARLAGIRTVVTSKRWWSTLPHQTGIWRVFNRLAYGLSARVLANSAAVAQSLRDEGVAADRVVTIPNFVEDDAFERLPAREIAATRAAYGLPGDALVVGIVARLAAVKDHGTLLRAVARIVPRHPLLHLVVVGDGPERDALEGLAASLGIAGQVRFTGTILSDGANLHAPFDVSVLCSLSEGFPNSLVEAMAAGRPVVATCVGGNADAVVDGVTGTLVPPADVDALAAALDHLVASAARREAYGAAGRQRAREEYHADAVMARLGALYATLAGRPRAGGG